MQSCYNLRMINYRLPILLFTLPFIFSACLQPAHRQGASTSAADNPLNEQKSKNLAYLSDPTASILDRFAKASLLLKKKVELENLKEFKQIVDFYCEMINPTDIRLTDPQFKQAQPDAFIDLGTLICRYQSSPNYLDTVCYKKIQTYFTHHLFNRDPEEKPAHWAAYSTLAAVLKCHPNSKQILDPIAQNFIQTYQQNKPPKNHLYVATLIKICQEKKMALATKQLLLPHLKSPVLKPILDLDVLITCCTAE